MESPILTNSGLETVAKISRGNLPSAPNRRPYPAYKQSGVEWLGIVPEHWEVKRLKDVADVNRWSLPEDTDADFEIEYVDISNVDSLGQVVGTEVIRFGDAPSRARRRVANGDTVLSTVRTYLRAIAHLPNPKPNLVVSTGFAVLSPNPETDPGFLAWMVRSSPFIESVVANSTGIGYSAIAPTLLACQTAWLPPLPEQRIIAAFLDRETARIDALIAKKQRLVELLEERQAAAISFAITGGLREPANRLATGIDWYGQIPHNWHVWQLRRVVSRFVDYRGHTPAKETDGVPLVTAKNIKGGQIDLSLSEEFISRDLYVEWMVRGFPALGDVLITTEAPLGEVAQVVDAGIALAQRVILLKTDRRLMNPTYLKLFLRSRNAQQELKSWATGSTAEGIKASHLREIRVIVPPLAEQTAICEHISKVQAAIEPIKKLALRHIDMLREHRSALITAAVTGKIDVREAVG